MSSLRGDLDQNSSMDLRHRPSSNPSASHDAQPSHEESGEERAWKEDLCHAICVGNWSDAKAILEQNPNALTAVIGGNGRTGLHVAAMFGQVTIVEELLKLLPPEFLPIRDSNYGYTALALACRYSGNTQLAKCLLNKNSDIVRIPSLEDHLPVTVAILNGYLEMGRYLYSVTPLECFKGYQGSMHLRICFRAQCFDIALNLLQQCEELLLVPSHEKGMWTPIRGIAALNTAILGPSELVFWKRWIYDYINIPSTTAIDHVCVDILQEDRSQGDKAKLTEPDTNIPSARAINHVCVDIQHEDKRQGDKAKHIEPDINTPSTTAINHVCVDIQQGDRSQGDKAKLTELGHDLLLRLITSTDNFVGINLGVEKIQELKLLHAQAEGLLRLVCKNARKAYQKGVIYDALAVAAKEGNVEFMFEVSKVIPEIFTSKTFLSCFSEALEYRQARVFNLIHGLRFKNTVVTSVNTDGNSLMHQAAIKAPDHVLNRIYAPTLQMQRELQWFKEVESLTPPSFRLLRNNKGMTAQELFRESHTELMKQGEKWIKATASSCSVVGTLIVTIMFAVAFTVPGGNDQNLGYPLFIKQPFFKVFIFSTILSLLCSSTSVLMFLAILTSQYSEERFLKSLPTKLILGLSFLFISIVSMLITFLSTIHLMLKHANYSWGLLPIIILASGPIFLFVLSQFPLLLHTYASTYGNIFDRKLRPWP